MKKITFFTFLIFTTGFIAAQDCNGPVSNVLFQQKLDQVRNRPNDESRFEAAKAFVQANCLTSQQITQLAMRFTGDGYKLQLAKIAWQHCFDRKNYYDVLDAFKTNAAAFRLYHFIDSRSIGNIPPDPDVYPVPPPVAPVDDPGPPCITLPAELEEMTAAISHESSSSTKLAVAKQIVSAKKCFLPSQIKELVSLMSFESDKLALAKFAYDYCSEKEGYFLVNDALSFSSSKTELIEYIKNKK